MGANKGNRIVEAWALERRMFDHCTANPNYEKPFQLFPHVGRWATIADAAGSTVVSTIPAAVAAAWLGIENTENTEAAPDMSGHEGSNPSDLWA